VTFRPAAWLAIALAALAGAGGSLPVFRDRLLDHFGLTTTGYGLLLNAGVVAGVAGALLGGPLLARIGERRMLAICLAGCIAGLALMAWPGTWRTFVAGLALASFFLVPLGFALPAYLTALYPSARRRIIAFNLVAVSVVAMLIPLLMEWLIAHAQPGDRRTFAWILHGLFGATALVLLAGLLAGLRRTAGGGGQRPASVVIAATLPRSAMVLLIALLCLHVTADTVLGMWMPLVLAGRSYAEHPVPPGVVMAAFAGVYAVTRLLLGILPEDRWRRRLMVLPGLCGGACVLAGILSRDQARTAIGYVAGACCWSLEFPVFIAALTGSGRRFGAAMAAFTVISGAATALLGSGLGLLGERLGEARMWQILLIPAALFPLVGLGGLAWVLRYGGARRRPEPTTEGIAPCPTTP